LRASSPSKEVDVEVELVQAAKPVVLSLPVSPSIAGVAAHGAAGIGVGIIGRGIAAGHRECS
jgi:hypothetical protein